MQLRPYQLEAVASANVTLLEDNRAVIAACCGSGKTLIAANLASTYKRVVVLSPLKAYAEQNLVRFGVTLPLHKKLLVDSDGCRDVDALKKAMEEERCIISATFKSADVVNELLGGYPTEDTLLIVDEFHNLSRSNLMDANDPFNQLLKSDKRILSLSATPR